MSAAASSSTAPAEPAPSPIVLLFARGVLSIIEAWPVMRAAVQQSWGGPESEAKRTWLVSLIVDEFEERWTKAGAPLYPQVTADQPRQNIAPPEGMDLDDLADLLFDVFLAEFDVELEDGSPEDVSRKVIAAWSASLQGDEAAIKMLEEDAAKMTKKKVDMPNVEGVEDDDDDSGSDDDADSLVAPMDVDITSPPQPRQREEPEVDEDGFTMVKGKGKKK